MIAFLVAVFPALLKILVAFIKTPEEKRADLSRSLVDYMNEVHFAVKEGKETGNYEKLESVINSRLHL